MTAVAMPLDKLDVWLQGRTGAAATNLSMLDGFVTAVVAGPVSMDPPEWICPLLGIEIRGDLGCRGPSQCDRGDAHQRTQDL